MTTEVIVLSLLKEKPGTLGEITDRFQASPGVSGMCPKLKTDQQYAARWVSQSLFRLVAKGDIERVLQPEGPAIYRIKEREKS